MEDLRWLGLNWDEGPDVGGPFAPYRQSERRRFYDEVLTSLRETRAIYPCFCSEERLEALRGEQAARGEPPRYDGHCRCLPPGEAEKRLASGENACWRFSLPDRTIRFHDEVRGDLSFAPKSMGDFIVTRSDGCPTYLFTSVADDRLMEITHIIRGDEHIPNTARQQALFDRLGWKAPVYAHIPMILSKDRQKLSKRTGSTPVRRYREEGYLPDAMTAYLSTLSWTPPEPLSTLRAAADAFSLDRVSASSPVHDENHLLHRQKEAMKKLGAEALLERLGKDGFSVEAGSADALRRLTEDLIEEYPTLTRLEKALGALFERARELEETKELWLEELERQLRSLEIWEEKGVNDCLRAFMKKRGLKGVEFFHPLRRIITGRDSGVALPLIMAALGREETLRRIALSSAQTRQGSRTPAPHL
jgi:glutamyl-tRNA synthetase